MNLMTVSSIRPIRLNACSLYERNGIIEPFTNSIILMANSCLETDFKILDTLSRRPDLNQRELARELGVSLGKAHYLLAALIDRGLVRAQNFKNSRRKLAYAYIQAPYGIKEKTRITQRFIHSKLREYEHLKREIEELQKHFDFPANLDGGV